MMNAMPRNAPAMQPNVRMTGSNRSLNPSKNIAGTENIMPDDAPFTPEEISDKIAKLLTPPEIKAEVKIVYQSIENLHKACPNHLGDWYFTGNYPTPGGNKVVNKAFINYVEGSNERAY